MITIYHTFVKLRAAGKVVLQRITCFNRHHISGKAKSIVSFHQKLTKAAVMSTAIPTPEKSVTCTTSNYIDTQHIDDVDCTLIRALMFNLSWTAV